MFERVDPPTIPQHLRWSYQQVEREKSHDARWIGPVHGLQTHHATYTRPCRADLTGGVLPCDLCAAKMPKRWRGYAPAVLFNAKQVVFLIGIDTGHALGLIARGTAVTWWRGAGETAPLNIKPYVGMAAKIQSAAFLPGGHWAAGVDLWPWLCHLWQDTELATLLERTADAPAKRPGLS